MRVRLKTSGGFANLRLEGEIDTTQLSPELAERIEDGLSSEALRQAELSDQPQLVDGMRYDLTILPETKDDEIRHFVIDDATVADEVLDILDSLLEEIIRKRREEIREQTASARDDEDSE